MSGRLVTDSNGRMSFIPDLDKLGPRFAEKPKEVAKPKWTTANQRLWIGARVRKQLPYGPVEGVVVAIQSWPKYRGIPDGYLVESTDGRKYYFYSELEILGAE